MLRNVIISESIENNLLTATVSALLLRKNAAASKVRFEVRKTYSFVSRTIPESNAVATISGSLSLIVEYSISSVTISQADEDDGKL